MRKIHLSKFPERPQVLKASLMFVEDNKICDGCDERVKCASIRTLVMEFQSFVKIVLKEF
jgi:hypothetical protein